MIFYLGYKVNVIDENIRLGSNKVKSWKYGYNKEHNVIIISKDGTIGDIFYVNGLNIALPQAPKDRKNIINWDKTQKNQIWKRKTPPEGLNARTQYDTKYESYIENEIDKRTLGVWVFLNGIKVYLPGTSYFFYQWNRLDEGYPNFRIIQNELMIYWEACKADNRCYGIDFVKPRRYGWTSLCNNEFIEAGTTHENKDLGIISKTGEDGRKMFQRLVRTFKKLPSFFMPVWDGTTTPKKELLLSEPSRKKKIEEDEKEFDEGLDTLIRYHSTVINAMDGDKIFRSAIDECFGKGTKILMEDLSFKKIEDIKVGEYVIVEGGEKVKVYNTLNGIDDLYEVTQPYSKNYIVNSKHRLYLEQRCSVKTIKDDGVKIMTPIDYLNLGKYKTRTTYGVRSKGLAFKSKNISLDPYILGLWLGDGHKDDAIIDVNIYKDKEIGLSIEKYCLDNNFSLSIRNTSSGVCKKYKIRRPLNLQHLNGRSESNKFIDKLKELNIHYNKHIPNIYFKNSSDVRLELLAGIIDSDGYLLLKNNAYIYEIGLARKVLFDDIVFLSRTLGFKVQTRYKKTNFDTDSWVMCISGDTNKIPCKIIRKQVPKTYNRKYASHINKIDINSIGKGEYFGITLGAFTDDDRRLILEDFTISMNCGKFPTDCPVDEYWRIVKTSHRQGKRIIGKSMMGSTVNALKKGGAEFKRIYDQSDPLKRNKNDQTISGLYRLFIDTVFCWEGFIDVYGFAIVDNPEKPMLNDLGEYITTGAITHWNNEAEGLKNDPEAYNEYLRQNPRTDTHAFRDEATDCSFNLVKILDHIEYNEETHNANKYGSDEIERGNFTWKDGIQDTIVIWRPDPQNGRFWIAKGCHPPLEYRNLKEKKYKNGVLAWAPMGEHLACFGVDPYNRSKGSDGRGSLGAIHLKTKYNTSTLPNDKYILEYIDRAATVELFFEDVLMAMVYYSVPMLAELSNEKFLTMIKVRGYRHFSLNNPFKLWKDLSPTEKELGGAPPQDSKIGDQQFFAIETYIEDYIGYATDQSKRDIGKMGDMPFNRTLKQWKDVDLNNRTAYDAYISSSLAELGNQRRVFKLPEEKKLRRNPFQTYDNSGAKSVAI